MPETNTLTNPVATRSLFNNLLQVTRDYYTLCKPKVVALMLLTVIVGMILSTDTWISAPLLIASLVGIALVASSAAVVNHFADRRIDAKMSRTQYRPLATGRLSETQAIVFSLVLAALGTAILWFWVNPLTMWLTLASMIGYALIYTFFLKRATPQNIVIGGLAGAMPPLLGWTSVTNSVDPNGLLLVLIIFAWTPPHFWALAIHRKDDYQKVDIPMLPVTHGIAYTKLHILLYTILLFISTILPFLTGLSGLLYLWSAILLNVGFMYYAIRLYLSEQANLPRQTFGYSIVYLMVLFVALLVDHWL